MASAGKQDGKKKTSSRSKKHLKPRNLDSKPGSSGSKLLESSVSGSRKIGPKKQTSQNELHLTDTPQSKIADNVNGTAKVSNNSSCKRKKALPKVRRNYSLRSLDRARILRSKLDAAKCKTTRNPASNPENLVTRKRKSGKKKVKKSGQDESSRILKHVRYMLNRMNYEQSLIDAYSGEGWKGQSVEKIRPEKELERAKSEILRCKLKIRGIFQHLDSLLAEGRLQESLFDSDGIDSESIFCGKCGSKDVFTDNDIILCDGICERGFHQKCLNPPLLSEDIPTGDEGWLCPQCDCKVECIDLLSEFRGTDLSIEDSWERIFPEAAVLANGNGKYDDLNLPSDDSEDDDYDPNVQRVDADAQEEGSGYEESESSSSSYDSTSSEDNMNQTTVELPTDDSEDDDYDPDAPDPEKEIQKSKSSSDESDFTSDSDEFCSELKKISYAEEASASSLPSLDICVDFGRDEMKDKDKLYDNSKVLSDELEIHNQESGPMSSHKRDRERLDYKKLYDEAYGNSSSESSEDEDWNEKSSPKKLKKIDDERIEEVSDDGFEEKTPKLRKRNAGYEAEKDLGPQEPHSRGFSSATVLKKSGVASKKLYEAFQENRYPTRERKESLVRELGMTFQQVTKWFGNARHSARVSANESSVFGTAASDEAMIRCDIPRSHSDPDEGVVAKSPVSSTPHANKKKLNEIFRKNQYPTREKKEELAQQLGLTFRKVSRWFETARRRSRSSAKESSNPATSSPNKASSHKLDAGEEEDTATGAFTPERAIITSTTSTSNAKHEDGVSPRDEVTTPKSGTSPSKPGHGAASDSPIANGAASNEIGTKGDEDRRKAIAKELRRMKKGR